MEMHAWESKSWRMHGECWEGHEREGRGMELSGEFITGVPAPWRRGTMLSGCREQMSCQGGPIGHTGRSFTRGLFIKVWAGLEELAGLAEFPGI